MKTKGSLRAISLLLVLLLSLAITVPVYASTDDELILPSQMLDIKRMRAIDENVINFLLSTKDGTYVDGAPVVMFNLSDQIEALYYPLQPSGYLVASYNDGHVIEYSPDGDRNVSNTLDRVYYNGPLEYYAVSSNGLTHLVTSEVVDKTMFASEYHVDTVDVNDLHIDYRASDSINSSEVSTPKNYVGAFTGSYYCTITGISNLLQWYVDYKNADMYASSDTTVEEMRDSLHTLRYVYGNGGLFLSDAIGAHQRGITRYLGLTSYFARSDIDSYEAIVESVTRAQVLNQIQIYKRPVLLTIDTALIKEEREGTHIVMAYKYDNSGARTYYYVNDGWKHNEVRICSSDIPETYEMMYIRPIS